VTSSSSSSSSSSTTFNRSAGTALYNCSVARGWRGGSNPAALMDCKISRPSPSNTDSLESSAGYKTSGAELDHALIDQRAWLGSSMAFLGKSISLSQA